MGKRKKTNEEKERKNEREKERNLEEKKKEKKKKERMKQTNKQKMETKDGIICCLFTHECRVYTVDSMLLYRYKKNLNDQRGGCNVPLDRSTKKKRGKNAVCHCKSYYWIKEEMVKTQKGK